MISSFRFWIFVIIGFVVAAKPQSDLTCTVTIRNNAFIYQLSRPPSFPNCTTCWETGNKTVIARNQNFLPVVQNLTDQSLTLNYCEPSLRYKVDCQDKRNMLVNGGANCNINCSRILNPKENSPGAVNSTNEIWSLAKACIVLGVIVIVIIILVSVVLWRKYGRRDKESGTTGVLYTHAGQEDVVIKTPKENGVVQNHIV